MAYAVFPVDAREVPTPAEIAFRYDLGFQLDYRLGRFIFRYTRLSMLMNEGGMTETSAGRILDLLSDVFGRMYCLYSLRE